jgi:hypothetical protein
MLIDFVYSYSKDVLQDAQAYGEAAGKAAGSIGSQDIELAIRSRSFAQPLSLQVCRLALNGSPHRASATFAWHYSLTNSGDLESLIVRTITTYHNFVLISIGISAVTHRYLSKSRKGLHFQGSLALCLQCI